MQKLNEDLIRTWLVKQFPDLIAAYLFGSFASEKARSSSDVDIAIYIPHKIPPYNLWDTAQELAILLGHDVDLVNLMSANTVFQFQIITQRKLLLSLDEMKRAAFESYVIRSYLDFSQARNKIIQDYTERRIVMDDVIIK